MKNINEILEKYYKGETSLDEEEKLKELITNYDLRITDEENLKSSEIFLEKEIFDFYKSEKEIGLDADFEGKLLNKISEKKVLKLNTKVKILLYRIAAIAAVFLVAVGSYFIFYENSPQEKQKVSLTEDEKFAIEQTMDALTMVSEYLNIANEQMDKLSIINSSLETINKVSYYEKYNQYIFNILGEES